MARRRNLAFFNLDKCYQPRAAPSLANCLKSPSKRQLFAALEQDLLEPLPAGTWDDYDEIAVVVLEFFQTGSVLKFLEENQYLVDCIRAQKEGSFPQSEHNMRYTFFGIETSSDEFKNLVKTCMDSLCSLSEATGTEMHLRSMRIANVCKMFGIAPGAKIITGLHHPVTRMFSGFFGLPYAAKIHRKKKGIKWNVVPFQYSQPNREGARNRMKERKELRKKKAEELKKKAEELKALKDKKAAELKALMKTREEKWGELTNNYTRAGVFYG